LKLLIKTYECLKMIENETSYWRRMLAPMIMFLFIYQCLFSTISIGIIKYALLNLGESLFQLSTSNISSIDSQLNCTYQCWTNLMCVIATHRKTYKTCSLVSAQLWQGQLKSVVTNNNTSLKETFIIVYYFFVVFKS